jgi:hypothetical protein
MNKERILKLADIIEKQPHTTPQQPDGFTMSNWTHDCGTPACICGWANHELNKETSSDIWLGDDRVAAEWLGLDIDTAGSLFEPSRERDSNPWATDWWDEITPAHAAAVLRNLAETGKVDWSVGAPVEAA